MTGSIDSGRRAAFAVLAGLLVVAAAGCGSGGSGSGTGQLSVALSDAPIEGVKEVNVSISRVEIHRAGSTEGGWETVFPAQPTDTAPVTFNLLSLANVPEVTNLPRLVYDRVPAGHYTQLRLIVQSAELVMEDGTEHTLVIPSGANTGLKVVSFDVPKDSHTVLLLDFDVAQSVNLQGDGTYKLEPVLRLAPVHQTATFTGKVVDGAGNPVDDTEVALKIGDNVVATSLTSVSEPPDPAKDGVFAIHGLPSGTYTCVVTAPGFAPSEQSVTLTAPNTTDAGSVTLTAAGG